ncbi:GNAT family N-acetyltransferase [Paenibacillus urinalis]|uniref:GNAT family N-acetyltransferase n=1 Tax=Paenibacillus urinalis TaxID=521520 RepID=A0AAX3N2G0_9BACL|nr:GNAT family N-acetyltransferase [Paenibacillus urinalis]WDH84036.1 GNAT family N-acetyltransferase [Paenibacillus urinalis]
MDSVVVPILINNSIQDHEVPDLRQSVGWDRREQDYPILFERCLLWGSARDMNGRLIGFGYITGTGLEHGYMEDIMIHPDFQRQGLGKQLVQALLHAAEAARIPIVTVTFADQHESFYIKGGFKRCRGGLWRSREEEQ